jgi:hypothetical protein
MKILPVGAEMFHADGDCDSYPTIHPFIQTDRQTDRRTYIGKLIVACEILGERSINNKVFRELQFSFSGKKSDIFVSLSRF